MNGCWKVRTDKRGNPFVPKKNGFYRCLGVLFFILKVGREMDTI